jgi:hypothetical protein
MRASTAHAPPTGRRCPGKTAHAANITPGAATRPRQTPLEKPVSGLFSFRAFFFLRDQEARRHTSRAENYRRPGPPDVCKRAPYVT